MPTYFAIPFYRQQKTVSLKELHEVALSDADTASRIIESLRRFMERTTAIL